MKSGSEMDVAASGPPPVIIIIIIIIIITSSSSSSSSSHHHHRCFGSLFFGSVQVNIFFYARRTGDLTVRDVFEVCFFVVFVSSFFGSV